MVTREKMFVGRLSTIDLNSVWMSGALFSQFLGYKDTLLLTEKFVYAVYLRYVVILSVLL